MPWFRDVRNTEGEPWFVTDAEYIHIKASPDYVEVFKEKQEKSKSKKVKPNGNDSTASGQ